MKPTLESIARMARKETLRLRAQDKLLRLVCSLDAEVDEHGDLVYVDVETLAKVANATRRFENLGGCEA